MNKSGNGRWGRYKTINGESHKLCNGPLHKPEGEWMPLHSYFIMKKGSRAGKPLSRCMACDRVYKGRDKKGGLVPVNRVWFIFEELRARIGKAETCRRLGISINLWYRVEHRVYRNMYRKTAKAAMLLLRELRTNNVARHRDSIRHGAAMRGHKEKRPVLRTEFNGVDIRRNEYQRKRAA